MSQVVFKQIMFYASASASRTRKYMPDMIILTLLLSAAVCVAGVFFTMVHPAVGEMITNLSIQIFFLAVTITAGGLGLAIARGIWLSCQDVTKDLPVEPNPFKYLLNFFGIRLEYGSALPAYIWTSPDCKPDVLIWSHPGESNEAYAERLEEAVDNMGRATWVVAIQKGNPMGMVFTLAGAGTLSFHRTKPPFQGNDWTEDQKIVPANTRFLDETTEQYQEYIDRFMEHYPEWSRIAKISNEPSSAGFVFQTLARAIPFALIMLFASGLFAQKSAQLRATDIANRIPESGQNIAFVFEKSDIYRTADGKKTYIDLLTSVPAFRDGGGGKLVAVMSGNRSVYKAEQTGDVATAEGRDKIMRGDAEVVEGPVSFSLPDSLTTAEMIERGKRQVSFYKTEFWKQVRPVWAFVMYCFWALMPILGVFGLILWFWAKLSASEEMPNIHWHSSRSLVILVGATWTVFIINAVMTIIYWELPPLAFFVCLAIIGLIAWSTAKWIVPNIQAKPGGRTAFTRTSHLPGLPGGN